LIAKHGIPESVEQLSAYPGIIYNMHQQKGEWRYRDNKGLIATHTLNRNFAANTAEMLFEAYLQGIELRCSPPSALRPI
jgi:hypothetical protein